MNITDDFIFLLMITIFIALLWLGIIMIGYGFYEYIKNNKK